MLYPILEMLSHCERATCSCPILVHQGLHSLWSMRKTIFLQSRCFGALETLSHLAPSNFELDPNWSYCSDDHIDYAPVPVFIQKVVCIGSMTRWMRDLWWFMICIIFTSKGVSFCMSMKVHMIWTLPKSTLFFRSRTSLMYTMNPNACSRCSFSASPDDVPQYNGSWIFEALLLKSFM